MDDDSLPLASKITTMAVRPPVMVDGQNVSINPQLLFQRLSVASGMCDEDSKRELLLLSFVLTPPPPPPSLFDKNLMMCTCLKSKLADAIWRQWGGDNIKCDIPVCCDYVHDGGALIHRLPWSKSHMTYADIITMCTAYVLKKIWHWHHSCL